MSIFKKRRFVIFILLALCYMCWKIFHFKLYNAKNELDFHKFDYESYLLKNPIRFSHHSIVVYCI